MDNIIEKEDDDARGSDSEGGDDQQEDELEFDEFYDERIKEFDLRNLNLMI